MLLRVLRQVQRGMLSLPQQQVYHSKDVIGMHVSEGLRYVADMVTYVLSGGTLRLTESRMKGLAP